MGLVFDAEGKEGTAVNTGLVDEMCGCISEFKSFGIHEHHISSQSHPMYSSYGYSQYP